MQSVVKPSSSSCCSKLQTLCGLAALTCKSRKGGSIKEQSFQDALYTRAWILHSVYTAYQLGQMALGLSLWLQKCPRPEETVSLDEICPAYNHTTVDPYVPALRI